MLLLRQELALKGCNKTIKSLDFATVLLVLASFIYTLLKHTGRSIKMYKIKQYALAAIFAGGGSRNKCTTHRL
jgi:hypothetical protein